MTTRETAALPPLDDVSPATAAFVALKRFGQWLKTRGWIHALLVLGMVVCIYPVVWMFMTSIMTDEELGQEEMVPRVPVFRGESPYVRDSVIVSRPDDVDPARFASIAPRLRDVSVAAVAAAIPSHGVPPVDTDAWVPSAASVLLRRAIAQVPRQAWNESSDAVVDRVRALETPEAVAAALSDRLARFELGGLTLRTLDGRLHTLPQSWAVESGGALLAPSGATSRLDYRFRDGGDTPVVLTQDFDLPDGITETDLHKLVLSIRADDTWHGVDATLDAFGKRWSSQRTTYLAQNRAQSLSFQPPTFDDTTVRAKTWVPLRVGGAAGDRAITDPHRARFRLIVSPSSQGRALFAKIKRNYVRAFDSVPFLQYVGNSLLLVTLTTAGALFSSSFVAYAFARLAWPGRGVALVFLLSTMMVPPQVTMIPSFLIWRGLGWYNTLNPLWVPAWLGNAFFIFLMIQHMKTIPRELEEAARIDGLGVVQTWWYIILPQLKPSLAAIAVMSFLGAWNEFMGPLIYLRDQSKFPLSLGLFGMRIDQGADWTMLMAANVLMTLPPLIAFFRFQRHIIEGVTVSGMKG